MDYSTIGPIDQEGAPTGIFPEGVVLTDIADRSARLAFSRSDAERVTHVLITLRRTLVQLEEIDSLDVELLEQNPAAGLVFERILANLEEMALDINNIVASSSGAERTTDFAASCEAAVDAGLIGRRLASALLPDDGPYHVILQLCLDAEPAQVPTVMSRAVAAYQEFEQRAAHWAQVAGRDA